MATNLPSCFSIQFLEQLLKFLVNFTLLKYVKSQRSYGFFITKELIFGFQILNLRDRFSASLISRWTLVMKDFFVCYIKKFNDFLGTSVWHPRRSAYLVDVLDISVGFVTPFAHTDIIRGCKWFP